MPPTSRPSQGSCYGFIPRLASLGWGYVHLCRDAPDLSEAVAACMILYTPRLATLSWGYLHLFEMPPTSPGPSLLA